MSDRGFEPAYPKDGGPGSTFINCRISERWPGLYTGRCPDCDAYFMAAKRSPRCDDCESNRLAALARSAPSTEADAARLDADQVRIDSLSSALSSLIDRHIQVATYAYGAFYDPEREAVVVQAREAVAGAKL